MTSDRSIELVERIRSRWYALDRDWQSVMVGAAIVGVVVLGVDVPW